MRLIPHTYFLEGENMSCPYCIKVCTKCGEILVANSMNFRKSKNGKFGLTSRCKRCDKEYFKEYYENNKEEIKEYKKEYYEDNKEEIKEKNKEYYENNPHIVFNSGVRRRVREENQGNGITKEQWLDMMKFFDFKCAYSGEKLNKDNRSTDHIVALNNGGDNEVWNCVPMLRNLNSSKNTNDMLEWYMQQEFFDINRLRKIFEWCDYAFRRWGNK